MAKTLKAAAVQMKAVLGNVAANLEKADRLVEEAARKGAHIIILPEFFTSAAAFHPSMLDAVLPLNGKASEFLVSKAKKHQLYVGGSFIASRSGERYNTFVLAMPDGSTAFHDKDQPTMWENCYYVGGHDDGIISTPLGDHGIRLVLGVREDPYGKAASGQGGPRCGRIMLVDNASRLAAQVFMGLAPLQ